MLRRNTDIEYSQEAQDIMGRIPLWIIRWGITIIFIIFTGIIIGCYFIKYPQIVSSPIIITTINPPADLIARTTGRIDTLFVKEGNIVHKGTVVALLFSTANFSDVFAIEDSIQNQAEKDLVFAKWVGKDYSLGELQSVYSEFSRLCLDYRDYQQLAYIEKKLELLAIQISKNKEYYKKLLSQKVITDRDLVFEQKNQSRDSSLFKRGVISELDYDASQRAMLQKESSQIGFEAIIKTTELSILQMEQQLIELAIQRVNEIAEYNRKLSQVKQQLISEIAEWRYQYVLSSPIDGTITLTKYWSNNQILKVGDRLASVIPTDSIQVIGRMMVPSSGFGKVKIGQIVNIKLNGFPYMEFGQLKGKVTNISEVPDQGDSGIFYAAEVILPKGLTTTYHKDLKLIQQMDGVGDIVTQDQRLIQRFMQPIRALFDN